MTILTYIICILISLSVIGQIYSIGIERKPITHSQAVINLLLNILVIYLLLI